MANLQPAGQSDPKKRIKPNESLSANSVDSSSYTQQQCLLIARAIKMIKQYPEFVALEIEHLRKTLSAIQKEHIDAAPTLKTRKQQCIQKGRSNIAFLSKIITPYRSLYQTEQAAFRKSEFYQIYYEAHTHPQSSPYAPIANMFHEIVKQWSAESAYERRYMDKIVELLKKYCQGYRLVQQQSTNGLISVKQSSEKRKQQTNIMVVGCSMGRILHQIRQHSTNPKLKIQGHQPSAEKYLCAEYFLNNCSVQLPIFPYIHNFSNFLADSSPYRAITIPDNLPNPKYPYTPLTLGDFPQLYHHHTNQWSAVVTQFQNHNTTNIHLFLQIIYKMLINNGIWIDVSTASFDQCSVTGFSYNEYAEIINNSQFDTVEKQQMQVGWYYDEECLMNQFRTVFIRVIRKNDK